MITRRTALTLAGSMALVGVAGRARAADFVNVLTGGTSGVYYPLGVKLADIAGRVVPGARGTAQATKASVENLNLLQGGRGEVAFTLADALADAWNGVEEAGFKAKLGKLRGMTAVYSNVIQIVAAKDSGIATLADLKGKKVAVGAPRSGTELNARKIFGAAGLAYADFGKVEYLPFAESVDLMKNRQLDATLISAGLGVAAIQDLASGVAITLLPTPPELIAGIGTPYLPTTIPAGTYKGQDAAVPAAAIKNFLVTHEGVDEAVVYALTKAVFDLKAELVAAHQAAKEIDIAAATAGMPVPLHPGAERYFKDVKAI